MTDTLFALVPVWGALAVGVAAFLSCVGVPFPSTGVMLAGGAFAAAGDIGLVEVVLAAWGGAVAGDHAGYGIGRWSGGRLAAAAARRPGLAAGLGRAEAAMARWGGAGVFLTRWLLSPLGPTVNLVAGATRFGLPAFTLWDVAGEALWVAIYVGLGFVFAAEIEALAGLLGNAAGLLAAGAVTVAFGVALLRRGGRRSVAGG